MSWGPVAPLVRRVGIALLAAILCQPTFAQTSADPAKLLEQAERLAWLKAWTRAAPLYDEAERLLRCARRSPQCPVRANQPPARTAPSTAGT